MVLDRELDAGWRLLADLLPQSHDSSMSRTKPEWRDWAPEGSPSLTHADYGRRVRDLVSHMLTAVGLSGQRWSDLIGALPNLPRDMHDVVTERLESLSPDDLTPEDRARVWDSLRNVIAQHRSFPKADWALPKDRIDRLDAIYQRMQPTDLASRFGWLFNESVRLPEGKEDDWEEEQKAIAEARRDAVRAIYEESGTTGIEGFIGRVQSAFYLGAAFGASALGPEGEDQLLREHLASEDRPRRAFAAGFAAGRGSVRGQSWLEEKFKLEGLSPLQRADILTRLPHVASTWDLARGDTAVDEAYWRESYPHVSGSAEDIEYAARRMMQYGRAFRAAEMLAFHLKDASPPAISLIADTLEAVLQQKEIDAKTGGFAYWAGKLLAALADVPDVNKDRVAKLEWGFAVILSHDRPPAVLHRELARSPEFFAELLSLLYRREDEDPKDRKEASEAEQNRATVAFHVLESWRSIPGLSADGVVDSGALEAWVMTALGAAIEKGRPTVGAQHIGTVLSHGPQGADGAWPHEAVRDVIEKLHDEEIERGFEIGKYNSRGVVTRSLGEGGKQEQTIADQYASWATQIGGRWPRTAAMLRRMEAQYRHEARSEDTESELRDEGLG